MRDLTALIADVATANSDVSAALAEAGLRPDQSAPLVDRVLKAAETWVAPGESTPGDARELLVAERELANAMTGTMPAERLRLIQVLRCAQWHLTRARNAEAQS